jgi:poly-gamma-glutamate synthesis protein (capsule biosynthesis protein)
MPSRRWISLVLVGLLLAGVAIAGSSWLRTRPLTGVHGHVVDEAGAPLAGISVSFSGGGVSTTDSEGRFGIDSRVRGGWVTAAGPGYLSRTRAALAGDETLVRLRPDDGETVRLLFGGDVMFGRRYYDPNGDGDPSDGLLGKDATVEDHQRLLAGVAPLLADADLTVVNLESALVDDPWFDPEARRPARFHPTKSFVFGSSPLAAAALHRTGVDIVGLGNNHTYDALEAGVESTRSGLLAGGYAATDIVGAGRTLAEAWQPAVREVRGQRIAFVACTTVVGTDHAISYVAGFEKGGAAPCEAAALADAVRGARSTADLVVVMIHGGTEYVREPTSTVRELTAIAEQAGAGLVINHHPHVVGGLEKDGGTLVAWTMGNLLFDQTVWPTFSSYVLRVDVRHGEVVGAYLEPIMLDGYLPVGVVGARADAIARSAQALSDNGWVLDDGSLTRVGVTGSVVAPVLVPTAPVSSTPVSNAPAASAPASGAPAAVQDQSGPILDLDGACLAGAPPADTQVGSDLAFTGDFEHRSADNRLAGGALWNTEEASPSRELLAGAAAHGDVGVRLSRSGSDQRDILLAPQHRLLVRPGDQLTVLLELRGSTDAHSSVQVSWYNDTTGSSQGQTVVPLSAGPEWHLVRIDLTVPPNGVAAGLYIRLAPPQFTRTSIDVDDVRVIDWHAADTRPVCGFVRVSGAAGSATSSASLRATWTHLPGTTDTEPVPSWTDAGITPAAPASPLPAGPEGGESGTTE